MIIIRTKEDWTGANDGLMAIFAEFAESKNAAAGNMGASSYQADSRPSPSQAAGDGFMSIPDGAEEELPFN